MGLVLLCGASGAVLLLLDDPTSAVALAGVTAFLAGLAREARVVLFCAGLTVTVGAARSGVVPLSLVVPTATIIAAALASDRRLTAARAPGPVPAQLVALTAAIALYSIARPAGSNAAVLTGFVLVTMPFLILAAMIAINNGACTRGVDLAFALGAALSIGSGLIDAYGAVGQDYAGYESARVFESSIGSSNYAAGLAAVVGVHLFSVCWNHHGLSRFILAALALSFMSAPIVFASRGALIAVVAGVAAFALTRNSMRPSVSGLLKRKSRLPSLVILATMVATLSFIAASRSWFIWERLTGRISYGVGYTSGRTELWADAGDLVYARPFFGGGPGSVTDGLLQVSVSAYSHVYVLDVLAQLGVVGGLLYLWITRPTPVVRATTTAAALVTIAVHSFIEPNISTGAGAALYAGLVACHAVAGRSEMQSAVVETDALSGRYARARDE